MKPFPNAGGGRRSRLAGALLLALLAAPAGGAAQGEGPSCPGDPAAGTATRSLGARGPQLLLDSNFPDPFVARFGTGYYAYATGNQVGGSQMNVQLVRSSDLKRWTAPVEALPAARLPGWVDPVHPQVWAPETIRVNGRYVLYFNARHRTLTRAERAPEQAAAEARILKRHCLGAAVADRPEGPFTGIGAPLVCSEFPDGTIDASAFRDGDALYLYFKDDGNCCGRGSAIFVQGLSADGLAAVGAAQRLVANDDEPGAHDDWEWRVVEAPTMVKRRGAYWLFYSGNFFGNRNYAVGALSCASPRGPCTDPGINPILYSHAANAVIGPGHQSMLEKGGRSLLFFHGWNEDPDAKERPGFHKRCLYAARLSWEADGSVERPRIVGGRPAEGPSPPPR